MADEEDDYLSDKFLVESAPAPSAPKTYAERRKEAQRLAAIKNEQNRHKSRRELEREAREEGLSKSLFERAQDEEAAGAGQQNKALAMMMKMGFKPGQALGRVEDDSTPTPAPAPAPAPAATEEPESREVSAAPEGDQKQRRHRAEPLPILEWAGRKGIGLGKRAASPTRTERRAKMAKMEEDGAGNSHAAFRDRARQEYEERRAHGRLAPAQRTCATLDEKAGVKFNVLWLNPDNAETFPEGLVDALDDPVLADSLQRQIQRADHSIEGRLRAKMRADALRPLTAALEDADGDEGTSADKPALRETPYSEDDIEEAAQFLRLNPKDRLELVLDYLRQKYAYCFWCGTQYEDREDMDSNCPGPTEDDHD